MAITVISSCKKENESPASNNDNSGDNEPKDEIIGSAPNEFKSKVVIEMFGGEWCDGCPDGKVEMQRLMAQNPDDVIGVVVHSQDAFETINYNSLFGHIGGVSSFPSAAINRLAAVNSGDQSDFPVITKQYWERNVNRILGENTNIGLALESKIEEGECKVKVLVNGNNLDIDTDYRLTLYIIENNVASINQIGKDNSFKHQMMLRGSLTAPLGESITLKDYETFTKEFTLNLKGSIFDIDNIEFVAFINTFGGNTSTRTIENAQKVKAGKTANWD